MNIKQSPISILLLLLVLALSCNKNSDDSLGKYSGGIFISNEGTFQQENGSVSYYNPESDTVINDLFLVQNGRSVGDMVHSLSTNKNRAYICVRGSGKVEVTDLNFKSVATIGGIDGARYFMVANNQKGYVSSWESNQISVIDLSNNSVKGTISIGHSGHDKMLVDNELLFIANSGGNGVDSTISVIDISSDLVVNTIYLDAYKPVNMLKDSSDNLWVLCQGKEYKHLGGPSPAKLIKISLTTLEISNSVQLFENQQPMFIAISPDQQTIYYGGGLDFTGIYKINTTDLVVEGTSFITPKYFSMGVDASSGQILALESPNYTSTGKLHVYSPEGIHLKSYNVGIAPGNINY
ncbi:MAG: hypothetical protein P1P88_18590 [Bacteroidales bacterium]|nr:hypothetical protein [Bacteroidales bacterium]